MTTAITRNLLLKEDINLDTDGSGAEVVRANPAGGTVSGHKLNASHLPITAAIRALMTGTATVEDALTWLVENFSSVGGAATTEQKGIIEIATLTEGRAGTDTVKAITPYLLKAIKASTTQFGTLLLASAVEALAGTDAEKAITPATLAVKLTAALDALAMDNVERGMITSINAVDAEHDIDVSVGRVADSTYAYGLELESVMTKRLDAVWEAGTGNGGLASALTAPAADTWYNVFAIYNPTSGVTDIGYDTDSAATNSLADAEGYTKYRKIATFLTDASANISVIEPVVNETYVAFTRKAHAYGTVSAAGARLCGSHNWTAAKSDTGKYQLNITDAGNYIVLANIDADDTSPYGDSLKAVHNSTTGYFDNNTASNIYTVYNSSPATQDSQFMFIAIKL